MWNYMDEYEFIWTIFIKFVGLLKFPGLQNSIASKQILLQKILAQRKKMWEAFCDET